MSKTYHPAIRNGKPVLVEKAEMEKPNADDYIEKQPRGITTYLGELHKDNKAYQHHLANLGVLEVSPELLNAMPELWCKLWFSDVEFSFKEEGYTGKDELIDGIDFRIGHDIGLHFENERPYNTVREVAIPLPPVIEAGSMLTPEQENNRDKYYHQKVLNPYPEDSQSNTAYKKGFYEAWDFKDALVKEAVPVEEDKTLEPIPDWLVKYDNANHQSSAGKAIRFLMQRIKELEQ